MEDDLKQITQDLQERPIGNRKGFWFSPFGKFVSTYSLCRITFFAFDYLLHQQDIVDSFKGPDDFYFYSSVLIGVLSAARYYIIKQQLRQSNIYTTFFNSEITDSLLKEIIEGKSDLSENSQKVVIMNQFWSSLPDGGRKSIAELEYLILSEGWDKKSLGDMIKHYVPSTISNLKSMGRIDKNYNLPYFN